MQINLFGDTYLEPRDVARKAITMALSSPFYRIFACGSSVSFYDDKGEKINLNNKYGLYAIYKDNVCLYVGETFDNIYYRIYRFQKELAGLSRHDESHSAAIRARRDGISSLDGCKVKFIPHHNVMSVIDKIDPNYRKVYGHFPLDEYAAPLLKSKYNSRRAR